MAWDIRAISWKSVSSLWYMAIMNENLPSLPSHPEWSRFWISFSVVLDLSFLWPQGLWSDWRSSILYISETIYARGFLQSSNQPNLVESYMYGPGNFWEESKIDHMVETIRYPCPLTHARLPKIRK